MFDGFSGGILIGVLVALVVIVLARLRPPPSLDQPLGRRTTTFTTPVPLEDALRAIGNPPAYEKFKAISVNTRLKRVLLSDGMGLLSWGFYYPVELVERPGRGTEVRIGIRSKAIQWGPLVTRAHREMTESVQRLVEAKKRPS